MPQLNVGQAIQIALGHHRTGNLGQAEQLCRQILEQHPNHPESLHLLGVIHRAAGRVDKAIEAYRRAIALAPNFPQAHYTLGNALKDAGRTDEAIAAYRQAIVLKPRFPEAHCNLGVLLFEQRQLDESIASHQRAIAIRPNFPEAHYNLGNALNARRQFDEAIAAHRAAIAVKPGYAAAHANLGYALRERGQIDEAITAFGHAISLDPSLRLAHDNLVYTLHFHPGYDARAICEEQKRWNRRHADALKSVIRPHANDRNPQRRLRVGYVSPDFREQAESFFTIPLLENHDHNSFEVYCYSSVANPDRHTERIRQSVDVWREVRDQDDQKLAEMIRNDRIDILVDLTMHMADNRAPLFCRKPAPLQICWLAYPGSSGLAMMDYRLTDSVMDPLDSDTSCYSEQSIRLPDCWVTYDPLVQLPPRAAEQAGPIVFGSLNTPAKLNDPLLMLWARVLCASPGSRLILQVLSPEHRQRIGRLMEGQGVSQNRLEFVARMNRTQYLRSYDRIDIALDPLPYNGITTTCDALYMGTPVLTLAGRTAAGRAGKAMLQTIGLDKWIAHTDTEFVEKAAEFANDIPGLIETRRGLRARMVGSPLMNGPRFARSFEAGLRQIWRKWCAAAAPDHI